MKPFADGHPLTQNARSLSKTTALQQRGNTAQIKDSKAEKDAQKSLYPWEQRLLTATAGEHNNHNKKLKAN